VTDWNEAIRYSRSTASWRTCSILAGRSHDGTAIAEQIVMNYGPSEFPTRWSDPFWFQAFGCVMGMDWHSSGITTSALGALKRGINPRFSEFGFAVCGGRGRHSVRTPDELRAFSLKPDSTATHLHGRAGSLHAWTTTPWAMASSFTCTSSSSRNQGNGRLCSKG
jgi:hypothetical protein